jgi:hypothetical protein
MLWAVRIVRSRGDAAERYEANCAGADAGAMNRARSSSVEYDMGSEVLKGSM